MSTDDKPKTESNLKRGIKQFSIQTTDTAHDVLGGSVGEGNVYITAYPSVLPDNKAISALEVGESTLARYSLSGSSGVYRIVRVEDMV